MNTSTPSVSPDHQASQLPERSARPTMPNAYSAPIPTLAATTHVTGAASTSSQTTSRTAASRSGRPMKRAMSARPASACNVEPAAMHSAAYTGGENAGPANAAEFHALSKNEPSSTPGHSRDP